MIFKVEGLPRGLWCNVVIDLGNNAGHPQHRERRQTVVSKEEADLFAIAIDGQVGVHIFRDEGRLTSLLFFRFVFIISVIIVPSTQFILVQKDADSSRRFGEELTDVLLLF